MLCLQFRLCIGSSHLFLRGILCAMDSCRCILLLELHWSFQVGCHTTNVNLRLSRRTLFVTGFPADMRERELNNLLRFLPGYEVRHAGSWTCEIL